MSRKIFMSMFWLVFQPVEKLPISKRYNYRLLRSLINALGNVDGVLASLPHTAYLSNCSSS